MADSNPTENWRPVVGYERLYEVSDLGRIRSLDRIDAAGRFRPGRIRRLNIVRPRNGVRYAHIALCASGSKRVRKVHHLVLEAFKGRWQEGTQACHNNGDSLDNRPGNLRWDTCKANHADRREHGTLPTGLKNVRFKLTADMVRNVKEMRNAGAGYSAIQAVTGLSLASIGRAILYGGPSAKSATTSS